MDVTSVAWRTSSYSGDNGGTYVEIGTTGPAIAVRDSNDQDGPQLAFPSTPGGPSPAALVHVSNDVISKIETASAPRPRISHPA